MNAKLSAAVRVSNIELFFDLVFVFTITQLTHLVDQSQGAVDLLGAFLVLVLIWWIYAGYAWLTNATGATGFMRFVLMAAMAGFLVMALAVPELFRQGGPVFGLAYLFVVLIHLGSFFFYSGAALISLVLAAVWPGSAPEVGLLAAVSLLSGLFILDNKTTL